MADFSNVFRGIQQLADHIGETALAASAHADAAVNQAYETVAPTLNAASQQIGAAAGYAYAVSAEKASEAVAYVQEQTQHLGADVGAVVALDEIGRKMAALGAPAIAFAVAASIAGGMGLAGGALVTTALALLGGPFGMIGGLIALGVLTLIADAVGKYGIEAVLAATFEARRQQGMTDAQIVQEIDALWLSDELKLKIKSHLNAAASL